MTDFERSYAVFTYYCEDLGFLYNATIGFSTGDGVYANHEAIFSNSVTCFLTPWVNVVYEISTLGKREINQQPICESP